MPIITLLSAMATLSPLPFINPVFTDHMVLQRDKPNTFWGWTTPGSRVKVSVAGKYAEGTADASGKWTAKLTPPPVGGPYTVRIDGPTKIELKDVLVGDVWICSGQSNMEMGILMAAHGQDEAAAANDPNLRLFLSPKQVAYEPMPTNPGGQWKSCTSENIAQGGWGGFSAVGYYFGKALARELKVPIGLIAAAWGGTSAEAWTSESALRPLGDFNGDLDRIDTLKGGPVYGTYLDLWLLDNDPGLKAGWEKPENGTDEWQPTQVPSGYAPMGNANGSIWLRKDVDLASVPSGKSVLWLGWTDDIDRAWVNGQQVGTGSGGWDRQYWFDSSLLRPGKNTIIVRLLNASGSGGLMNKPEDIYLGSDGGQKIPLGGEWLAKVGAKLPGAKPPRDTEPNPTVPTVIVNGMIAPIAPLAVRGAIWYQGETNGGRGYQYRKLLPALIGDWRHMFGQGDFPFYVVSLANWMQHRDQPGDDGWAELREAQAMTAKHVKNSGLVVTIDVGDAVDIHPKDKRTVGERLALNALANEYHRNIPFSGPVYRSMKKEGSSIRLLFDHTDKGLVDKGGKLAEFAIAGEDRKWHWAEARIDGNTVIVNSSEVKDPVAVRYAWQANPVATLYNGAGLPAVPFRTDDWPLYSANNK